MDIEKNRREEELKNELLTNISHEFKTPVNVIYSAIQTQEFLQNSNSNYVHENYTNIIKQNCNRLIRLIDNFIDITRLEKGSITKKASYKFL
ncbi:sensor histidine kinase KdpD [uncultured Clostridium sp.]|uniref:sensor histidine kinase n=1 Tax=uncultured Clostridium sp. TaxID=59620 RepID=UPI0025EA9D09|nr:histidine kinase dimerization/phospho-acceptor domain-containing protein [uncultured Clostridium sp.]